MTNINLGKVGTEKLLDFINKELLPIIKKKFGNNQDVIRIVNKIAFFVSCDGVSALSAYSQLLLFITYGDRKLLIDIFMMLLKVGLYNAD